MIANRCDQYVFFGVLIDPDRDLQVCNWAFHMRFGTRWCVLPYLARRALKADWECNVEVS